VANNNFPQITSVTSEALQAQLRNLLPSQEGFGTDLMAQNVIVPVIDLTSAAEGSSVPQYLQTAWDSATDYDQVSNTTTTLINNTGFWQVDLNCTVRYADGGVSGVIQINDGTTTNKIWQITNTTATEADTVTTTENKFIVFLRAGDSLEAVSNSVNVIMDIWHRQVATVNGVLVNPLGFTPQ